MSKVYQKNKYKNIKKEIDGITFDSIAESEFYLYVKFLEKKTNGAIKLIECQPKIYLSEARILYKPDFLISEHGQLIYVDVKGFETPVFKLKKRLWKAYKKETLRLVKKKRSEFVIIEEIKT